MTDGTRQQRRKAEREQIKIGQKTIAAGLSPMARRPEIIAVARLVHAKLGEAANEARASEAAGLAHSLAERSLASWPSPTPIACQKGCGYCCHTFVAVLPPEAFLLARAVRAGKKPAPDIAAVIERCRPLQGLSPDQRTGRKLACPLLVDGSCSVYAARPLVCRQATSMSLAACISEFEGTDRDGRVEVSGAHITHSGNANMILLGAMVAHGLPLDAFELSSALAIALADPHSERRWLAGEDIFRDLPSNVPRDPQIVSVARRIGDDLRS